MVQLIKKLMPLLLWTTTSHAAIERFYTLNSIGQLAADEPEFNRSISEISNNIDAYKLAELNLNIVIKPQGDNASFDTGNIIEIPRSMHFTNEYGSDEVYKTTINALSVYAHEYGHAVFDAHIGRAIPQYENIRNLRKQISMLALRPLNENLSPQQGLENKSKLQRLNQQLIDDKEMMRMYRLTLYYHELFADTVAVYTTDDKSAIFEALYNPNTPSWKKAEWEYVEARDFALAHPVTTWTNNSEHGLFAPLRSQIGREECWPKTLQEKTSKLKHLIKILLIDLKTKNENKTFPAISDNETLIEKFKEICK